MLRKLAIFLSTTAGIASCSTAPPVSQDRAVPISGDSQFCAVASNKPAYVGKLLILKGTYITDLRHFSMLSAICYLLSAICDGKEVGFGIGYGPSPIKWTDPVVKKACEIACRIEASATVTGTLVERDGGIHFDFSEMKVPDGLTQQFQSGVKQFVQAKPASWQPWVLGATLVPMAGHFANRLNSSVSPQNP